MVRVTLSTTLTTIQNRHALPAQPLLAPPPPNMIMPDWPPGRSRPFGPLVSHKSPIALAQVTPGVYSCWRARKGERQAFTSLFTRVRGRAFSKVASSEDALFVAAAYY